MESGDNLELKKLYRIFVNDPLTKDGKKGAVVISKHLAVALSNRILDDGTYKVYLISTNLPLIDCRIADYESACKLAEWIEDVYGEYLEIYETCPDWDVLAIARLSVPNGEKVFAELSKFNNRDIITTEQMEKARERALA